MSSTDRSHLTLVWGGADSCPAADLPVIPSSRAEINVTAALASRMCDELAATAEHGQRRVAAQLAALERGDLLATVRCAMDLDPLLRSLASSLGALHVLLEEIADTSGDVR